MEERRAIEILPSSSWPSSFCKSSLFPAEEETETTETESEDDVVLTVDEEQAEDEGSDPVMAGEATAAMSS